MNLMDDINLTQQFLSNMERKILSGEWAVASLIPSFRDLAKEFCVSRSVVNTAISGLETKGYVTIIPRKGALVKNWRTEGTLSILNDAVFLGYFDPEIIDSLFSILSFIECNGVFEAASRAKSEDLSELNKIIEQEAVEKNHEKLALLDFYFHKKITTMSNNMAYSLIFSSLEKSVLAIAAIYTSDESAKQQSLKMHKDIYNSLKERDGQRAKWEIQTLLDHLRVLVTYKTCNLK